MDDAPCSRPGPTAPPTARHGGDLAQAEARFGPPPAGRGWLDLSTGINAGAYPLPPLPPGVMTRLPGARELEALLQAARAAYNVAPAAAVVAAPGTQALIQALPALWAPATVAIGAPTYAEHAVAWARAGHRVERQPDLCRRPAGAWTHAVVVNPNNPDGRVEIADDLLATAAAAAARGGVLVVDEAFADGLPGVSVCGRAGGPGLVVLRSFGKFFGLAGVRLGFAIGEAGLMARLQAALGPWAVSGPALWAGTAALADTAWAAETRARLTADAARLDALLGAAGMEVIGGTDLFRLARHRDADAVYQRLGAAGVWVRRFDDHPTWLRFGLPGTETDWARLAAALTPVA